MAHMTLAFAVYFDCPQCGWHIDVGESSEEITREGADALAREKGMHLEGVCPGCDNKVTLTMKNLKSRPRN